jgi:ArsR family transcriptional regulator
LRQLNTAAIVLGVTVRFTRDIVYRRFTINEEEMATIKAREAQTLAGGMQDSVRIAVLAKALAHPARLGIIKMLHERQGCIGCDIVDRIGLAQSTVSEHLRILKAAGIVTGEIEGPRVCYALEPSALEPLRHFLGEISAPAPRTN